jgi:hypothetical protein
MTGNNYYYYYYYYYYYFVPRITIIMNFVAIIRNIEGKSQCDSIITQSKAKILIIVVCVIENKILH